MQPVAFFDIDGTIFRSSLLIEVVEELIRQEIFPATARTWFDEPERMWRDREGAYQDYIAAVVESFETHIQGVHYGEFKDVGRTVVATQSRRVYRYTRDLITELQADGYYIVAVSHSPKAILDEFCQAYGFDKVYGRILETGPQDRFTGAAVDAHLIDNKANIAARVFDDESVSREGSIAVGDTNSDIPLLESVDRPICFNPNQQLYQYATQMGWEVVVERKDVIYTL